MRQMEADVSVELREAVETVLNTEDDTEEDDQTMRDRNGRLMQETWNPNPQCDQVHLDEVIVNKKEAEAKHNSVSTEEVGMECDGTEAQLMAMSLSKMQTECDSEFCFVQQCLCHKGMKILVKEVKTQQQKN